MKLKIFYLTIFTAIVFCFSNVDAYTVNYQSGTFQGMLNAKIFYQYWQVDDPVGVLVIAHGFGEHSNRYLEMAGYFSKLGFSCYALDHRGHGRSEGDRWNVEDFDYFLDDLHTYINMVKNWEKQDKVFLLGHSMGGEIAIKYALTYPQDLDGLIVSSPSVGAYLSGIEVPQFANTLIGTFIGPLTNIDLLADFPMPGTQIPAEYLSHDKSVVDAYVNDPMVCHEAVKVRMSVELSKNMSYIQNNANLLNVPVLVMYGTDDKVVPPDSTVNFYDKVKFKNKKLIGFEGYYHEIFNEIGKEDVYKATEDWLNSFY
jgi:alpha-beta hydrolase superfamily lysophospholipase